MKKQKQSEWPKHKMGKVCGYEEFENGDIRIAPDYVHRFDAIIRERQAVDTLIRSVLIQCHKLIVPIKEQEQQLWTMLADDYGLDLRKYNYSFNADGGIVTKKGEIRQDKEGR